MQEKTKWEKPSIKEFDSAKDFIQGAGTIDGVRKEVGIQLIVRLQIQ